MSAIEQIYQKYVTNKARGDGDKPTTRIALPPIDPATVERRRLVAVLQAEYDFLEAFGTASDDTQVRYHKVHEALTNAGVTLARPGTLTKRIAATLALGDELARVLQAEMRYIKAHEDCKIDA